MVLKKRAGKEGMLKKHPIDSDPKLIFSFPYLKEEDTISYIKNHGKIMFILRGPPNSKKTQLRIMLQEKYPDAVFCSAVKEIDQFNPPKTAPAAIEVIHATHTICGDKVEEACIRNEEIIIVQNTHIKYFELKRYLEYAATYNYTIIMSVTLYRLDIKPKDLLREGEGLDGKYITKKFLEFQDVLPKYTGWFLSPRDSEHLIYLTFEMLESLLQSDGFKQSFNIGSRNKIENCFKPRKVLSCLAAYTEWGTTKKSYYLSNTVQAAYGKMFEITLIMYLVYKSGVIGIVHVDKKMQRLISDDSRFQIGKNPECPITVQHGKTTKFPEKENLTKDNEFILKPWEEGEDINIANYSFIHLAQNDSQEFQLHEVKSIFSNFIKPVTDKAGILNLKKFTHLENGAAIWKLDSDAWLVKASKKISIKTIFTGFYA